MKRKGLMEIRGETMEHKGKKKRTKSNPNFHSIILLRSLTICHFIGLRKEELRWSVALRRFGIATS